MEKAAKKIIRRIYKDIQEFRCMYNPMPSGELEIYIDRKIQDACRKTGFFNELEALKNNSMPKTFFLY